MAKSVKQAKEQKKKFQYTDAKATVKKIEESGSGPTSFKVPKGMSRFKFEKAGTYRLNIIPYTVGKHNPNADEGQVHYERTFEVHKGVGVDDATHACLKQFGERCPICEHAAKLQRDGADRDAIKEFRPKTRQLYLVMDLDNKEAGVQLFETGYYMSFGELLATKIKAVEEDDDTGYDKFFHLGTDGKVLRVLVEKAAYEGRGYFKPVSIEMRDRREEKGEAVPESILDEVPCLDELLINPGYKELKKLFDEGMENHADSDDEDDDTETTADADDEEDDEDEKPAPKKKDDKAKKKVEVELEADDEDDEENDADDTDEDEEADSDDEEDEEVEINKKTISGKLINFTNKAGKKMTGTVVLANDKTGIALIRVEGQAKQEQAKYDTISLAKAKAEDEDDDSEENEDEDTEVETDDSEDEGDDDEEEEADAEEDENDDEEESEDEDSEEEDEEWDLDQEDDEEEEEEKPAAKKGKAKPAAKAAPAAKKKGK